MKLISHRGNISGRQSERENTPDYIVEAINKGFDVEIDVWFSSDIFYLGHDSPETKISLEFLLLQSKSLWCHAKNIETLTELLKYQEINCFFHQTDDCALTSHNQIWTYFDKPVMTRSILLKFEIDHDFVIPKDIAGICSDNIEFYKNI